MKTSPDICKLNGNILKIKALLIELEALSPDFPALSRNSKRALATIKMMELNLSDLIAMDLIEG